MDMATNLRMRMAERQISVAEVCSLVGRNRITVSRWRNGGAIPLEHAQTLHAAGLLDANVILPEIAA